MSRTLPLFVLALALAGPALATLPTPLVADGGTLRVANVPIGAYRINVFTDPTPIHPDSIDVSVLATYERGRGVARDLVLEVVCRRLDGGGSPIRRMATRGQAEDPRYYAAKFALGSVGESEITVRVEGPEGEGEVSFQVTVQEPGLLDNPYLVLFAAFLPLLLVGVWLRSTKYPRHFQQKCRGVKSRALTSPKTPRQVTIQPS